MQIVIDIPDEAFEYISTTSRLGWLSDTEFAEIIKNGTPLPEGHGRIGDLDQILLWMIYKKGIIDDQKCGEIAPVFKDATILEAESEGKE